MQAARPRAGSTIPAIRRTALRLLAVGALAVLAGCGGTYKDGFMPACPHAQVLPDAADLTRYRPGATGSDLTDLVLDGRITGVSGDCSKTDRRHLVVTVTTVLQLMRGPAAHGDMGDVPIFLAVSRNGVLLDKQVYRIVPAFPPNTDRLRIAGDPVTLNLPISPEKPGSTYDVVVEFQPTPAELAVNRRRGPR